MRRCGLGWLLLLLLAARLLPAQQLPGARQELDARFLRARGLGPASTAQALTQARHQAALLRAAREAAPVRHNSSTTVWQPAGPVQLATSAYGLVTGRISAVAVDPNDATGNTVYLGAVGGGVWKSTNAAGNAASATFQPLTDDLSVFANSDVSVPSLSIGTLTVQPGNSEVLLAGTGDPNNALDSYYGVGILRSTNGGQSWSLIQQSADAVSGGNDTPFAGLGMAQFAWSTATPNLVVVAASQAYEGALVSPSFATTAVAGLYYSTDAGQTWHLATITDGPGKTLQSATQYDAPPGNPATSVVWNAKRGLFLAAVRFHGYYGSPDGITWTRLANQPSPTLSPSMCPANPGGTGNTSCPIFRGTLAVQPVTADTFALTTDQNNVDQGLFQDVCAASGGACSSSTLLFGTQIADSALDSASSVIDQADYSLALAAVPSQQDTLLFVGTTDIFRCSLANSCTWRNTTNTATCVAAEVAPSAHSIDGTFGANGLMFFGTDGGLWRSTDDVAQTGPVCAATDGSHYQNLNGGIGSLAEVSHLAVNPTHPALMLAGVGEFGVAASETAAAQGGTGPWQQLLTGEGSYVGIDPVTPSNWYADNGPGVSIFACQDGGNCTAATFGPSAAVARSDVEDDADYLLEPPPWILDPSNPASFFVATCRIWRGPVTGGWSAGDLVSDVLDAGGGNSCDGDAAVRSIGAGGSYNSSAGGEMVYAGMAGPYDGGGVLAGHLYSATVPSGSGTVSWTDLWRNPVTNTSMTTQFNGSSGAISSIAVDPHDTSGLTLYAGVSTFPTGQSGVLYRSTDGGAHWANITNSLPFAPVNHVLVDPVNAGTVYVAGDFGVYYTTNVASCVATGAGWQNCWSVLGSGLPNAPVTDLKLAASGSTAVLVAATYGRGIWTLGLPETPVYAQATLSPATYTFPATGIGSTSPSTAIFSLTNTGSVPLDIFEVTIAGDFAETNNCGGSLAIGGTCGVSVTFAPTTTGTRTGSLTVHTNTVSGLLTASLNGTGVTAGTLLPSPGTLIFPLTASGAVSSPRIVTLANTGGAPVSLSTIGITGADPLDFSLASGGTCGAVLAANATCSIPVVFSPVVVGTLSAQLEIQGTALGSPFFVSLQGASAAPAVLSLYPGSLTFPSTPENSTSASQTLNLSNGGGIAAQLGSASVLGDYLITSNTCGATLAPETSCSVGIALHPNAIGTRNGLFTMPSPSIPAGQVTASLTGTGSAPVSVILSPTALSFAAQQVGTSSPSLSITVSNTGSVSAPLATPTITGDFALQTNTCGTSLAAGSTCSLAVVFTPVAVSSRTGQLSLPVASTTLSATLAGTGTAPPTLALNPASLSFAATAENATSAPQTVALSNTGGNPLTFSAITASTPFAASIGTCPVAPATLAVGGTCNLQVSFAPTTIGTFTGPLTVTGNFTNSPATLTISGTGSAPPAVLVAPSALSFPDTAEGAVSAAETITVTSSGGLPVTFTAASVTAGYQIAANTCNGSLAPGGACTVSILFHPTVLGSEPGTLTLGGTMVGSPVSVTLSGNGLSPGVLTVTPGTLSFGTIAVGTDSPAQIVTVSNTGGANLSLSTPVLNGDYQLTASTCGATLPAGQSCTLSIAFAPTTAGTRAGQITLSGAPSTSATVTLAGAGASPGALVFSPGSLGFGVVPVGSSSALTTTASNSGGLSLHVLTIAAGGDFSISGGSCAAGQTLAPGASCTLSVIFAPSTAGTESATISVTTDGTPALAQLAVAGVGARPGSVELSPSTLVFGPTVLGSTATAQTVTASNPGGVPVTLSSAAVNSPFAIASDTCGASLAAGASCTIAVTFAPTVAGPSTASLSLPGQYTGSPATVQLSGTSVLPGAFAFTPAQIVFNTAVVGTTSSQAVSLANTGGVTLPLSGISVSSGFAVQSQCGAALAPGASCGVTVSFTPRVAGASQGLLTAAGSASSTSVPISATAVPPGALTASPASLLFSPSVLGSVSAAATVTFTDSGGIAVALDSPQVSSSDYSITATTCGATIAASASCTVTLVFHPNAAGNRTATLTLAASASGGPVATVSLGGIGLQPAALSWTPSALHFGPQPDRTTSPSQFVTLTNVGGISTALALPVLSGQYQITSNSCAGTLAVGATCSIAVEFAPVSDGAAPGTLSIAAPSGTPAATAALTGTGQALAALPTSIVFPGALLIGTPSAPIAASIENLGNTSISLSAPVLAGDFAITSSTCGTALAASSSCTVFLTFTPTGSGQRSGSLTYTDGADTVTVTLAGTGLSPATDTLSTTALSFSGTALGATSTPIPIVLTNAGDAALTAISVTIAGPFLVSNNCGASLGGHLSCAIAVAFAPESLGVATGVLTVADAARTQTVPLSGQGLAPPQPSVSPNNIAFGSYAVNATTAVQQVTVSNPGSTPMAALAVTVSGSSFAITTSNCSTLLAAGASCQVGVAFTPASVGNQNGVLTIASTSLSAPLSVALSGNGEDFQLSVVGSGSSVITPGQPATYGLTLTAVGASSGALALACVSGLPANATCSINPATLTIAGGTSGSAMVTITTSSTATTADADLPVLWHHAASALLLLCPCLLRAKGRRWLLLLFAALLASGPIGCGVHASGVSNGSGSAPPGTTPSGSYTVTVAATFPGAQRTATVQLTVQ